MPSISSTNLHDEVQRLVPLMVSEGGKITDAFALKHRLHRTDADALSHLMVAYAENVVTTIGSLGGHLGLTSGAVTFAVNRLERAGLVRRNRDPHDHRRILLALSDNGRDLAERFYRPIRDRTKAVLSSFNSDELEVVRRFLVDTVNAMADCRATFEN